MNAFRPGWLPSLLVALLLPGLLESAPLNRVAGSGTRRVEDRQRGKDVAV